MSSLPMYRVSFLGIVFALMGCLTGCEKKAAPPKPNIKISYLVTKAETVPLITELPGRVSAYLVSEVRPQVSGIIQKRLFEEGTDVKEGQQLYQIDPALFQAAYNSAKADLSKAQANVVSARLLAERYSKIIDINAVSKQEYDNAIAARDQAVAAVQAARQAVETARINLQYTKVLSPVTGRTSRSFVTPGALVTQNQADPLTTVQQLAPVYVDVTQSSIDLLKLRRALAKGEIQDGTQRGAKVKLKLEDGSPYAKVPVAGSENTEPEWILGEFQFSGVTIEESTGVVTVRAIFENPDYILLPGMYVHAVIEEGVREGTILIPQKTVMYDPKNRPYVYVLTKENQHQAAAAPGSDKDAATPPVPQSLAEHDYYVGLRYVTVDNDYKNNWLITGGLKPGDRVMVDGLQKVKPGQVVTGEEIKTASADAQPAPAPESATESEKAE